ncbi:hypothetical protein PYCC9005_003196 [Savitreella phatthalungensis]
MGKNKNKKNKSSATAQIVLSDSALPAGAVDTASDRQVDPVASSMSETETVKTLVEDDITHARAAQLAEEGKDSPQHDSVLEIPIDSRSSNADSGPSLEALQKTSPEFHNPLEATEAPVASGTPAKEPPSTMLTTITNGSQQHNEVLEKVRSERDAAVAQYRSLLSKVSQMKATLGERLKQDTEEIAEQRTIINALTSQNVELREKLEEATKTQDEDAFARSESTAQVELLEQKLATLQQEKQEHSHALLLAREEHRMRLDTFETASQEEKHLREQLRDRIAELEEQLVASNAAYQNATERVDIAMSSRQALEHELQTLRDASKAAQIEHLHEIESIGSDHDLRLNQLRNKLEQSDKESADLRRDLDRMRPYEQEVKEKNLLIGKLRHEAVILNEHLTKALRLLKRGSSGDSVDRQLLNNILLSFLSLPRQDSKRFEVLKVMSSVLGWSDSQQEMAGLLKPGTSALGQLAAAARSPPASPSLNRTSTIQAADFVPSTPGAESMSQLWINFLQSQSDAGITVAANPTEQEKS